MEVITISLGRGILEKGSREYERMRMYAEGLDAFHVIVLTRTEHGYREPLMDGSLAVYPTNSRTRAGMLIDAFRIGRRILRAGSDRTFVVSAQDPLEIGWISWLLSRRRNARLHIQVHGDYFGEGWAGRSVLRRVRRLCAKVLLQRAPAIRVMSERIKRSLTSRGIAEAKITVLPIRPELEAFLPLSAVSGTPERFTFLYAGRLAPEKDIPRIVRAFARLSHDDPSIRLKIIGSGSEEKDLRTQIDALGVGPNVTHVPWTSRIADEMAGAQALVLASKHEAYGLVLLEAMAVGLPAVTTDVGCVGEVFEDGIHGITVRETGDAALAEAMRRMRAETGHWDVYAQHAKETARLMARTSALAYRDAWVNALRAALI